MDNSFCYRPFSEIEIYSDGNVYVCCPDFMKDNYFIGNIFEAASFNEIWYSEKARKIRLSILNNEYKYCKTNICHKQTRENIVYNEYPPLPQIVRFSYDLTCNIRCIYCRDTICKLDNINEWNKIIDNKLLPLLSNAKLLVISTAGEITASKHSQLVIQKAIKYNPNLKFDIMTNGLLFNKNFIDKLAGGGEFYGKINEITLTLNAATKNTYERIMRGSDFDKVIQNIHELIILKKEGYIKSINCSFVVSEINFKEIPAFLKFIETNNLYALIFEFRRRPNIKISKRYDYYTVWNPKHPQYNEFVDIINTIKQNFPENIYRIPPLFNNLKKIPYYKNLLNKINYSLLYIVNLFSFKK